jgi:DNA repair protein RadA/Sms
MTTVPTGLRQLDHVLGGGLAMPSMTLLAGDPGTGKSTLLLQAACGLRDHLPPACGPVLYVSTDERVEDMEARARRVELSIEGVHVRGCSDLSKMDHLVNELRPSVLIVDTMHCVHLPMGQSAPHQVSDLLMARCAYDFAHARQMAIILVSGTTRLGTVPSQQGLKYLFDHMLLLRMGDGPMTDRDGLRQLRVLGAADSVTGTFTMGPRGLVSAPN